MISMRGCSSLAARPESGIVFSPHAQLRSNDNGQRIQVL